MEADQYILILEYTRLWDRNDGEKCNVPVFVSNDLRRAVESAKTILMQEGHYGSNVKGYRISPERLPELKREDRHSYYDSPVLFVCEFTGMENDKGTDMELEWTDTRAKKLYKASR